MKTIDEILNLQQAVSHMNANFDGMENYFYTKTEDEFATFCHSQLSGGIGMKVRNYFNFWTDEESILFLDLKENHGCEHPDSMSDRIIRGVYRLRNDLTFIGYIFSNYEVKESKKAGSIHLKSTTGIQNEKLWDNLFIVIKNYFGDRFQEVFHNTCTYHVDFTIYLKS